MTSISSTSTQPPLFEYSDKRIILLRRPKTVKELNQVIIYLKNICDVLKKIYDIHVEYGKLLSHEYSVIKSQNNRDADYVKKYHYLIFDFNLHSVDIKNDYTDLSMWILKIETSLSLNIIDDNNVLNIFNEIFSYILWWRTLRNFSENQGKYYTGYDIPPDFFDCGNLFKEYNILVKNLTTNINKSVVSAIKL